MYGEKEMSNKEQSSLKHQQQQPAAKLAKSLCKGQL